MGFPTSGLSEGYIRTHEDGRRWTWRAAKGVWRIKKTLVDDSNFTGATGATGATGSTGANGSNGSNGSAGAAGADGADGVDATAPSGAIVMWSGSVSAIPSGWVLCDGNNSTPNLVGKFIKGGSTAGTTGGTTSHSHSHTLSAGAHTLSTAQMPSHTHGLYYRTPIYGGNNFKTVGQNLIYNYNMGTSNFGHGTGSAGSSSSHSHSLSGSVSNGNHEPPYYTICYIMKT